MKNKICSRCLMDTTVDDIWFDEKGVCKYCYIYDYQDLHFPLGEKGKEILAKTIGKIKKDGRGKTYDCIVGVSGGRDSSYLLMKAVDLGLRPLAVHFDNGWNSKIAVSNIKNACERLNVDLHTIVADWEEFKDLQRSFLFASIPQADIPTDWVLISVLKQVAYKEKVKYILNGHSFRTEGNSPISWSYMDGRFLKSVQKTFGTLSKFKSFPIMSFLDYIYYVLFKRIQFVLLLTMMDYEKKNVDEILKNRLGWEYYGGHHHENIFTQFFQSYYLPQKFGIDKRKTELSAMVRSGQITREEALYELNKEDYQYDREIVNYAISKLGFTPDEFVQVFNNPNKSFLDYETNFVLLQKLRFPIMIATKMRLIPPVIYYKISKGHR